MNQLPDLCIPVISRFLTKERISTIFKKLKWGNLLFITIKSNRIGRSVYISFKKWENKNIRNKFLNGEEIFIVHDFPLYLKCVAKKN